MRPLWLLLGLMLTQSAWAEWFSDTQAIMGTEVSVTLWHADAKVGMATVKAAMAEMHRLDRKLSPYIESSELSKVNAKAGHRAVSISPELALLIDRSLYYSRLTEGAFDITFSSLGRHYDYRAKQQPSPEQTRRYLPAIDYRLVRLDRNKSTLSFGHAEIKIDLGGIAKGYAVDRAVAIMQRAGVKHGSVSAGGDSRVLGDRLGRPWLIGIKNPRGSSTGPEEDVAVMLPLVDTAVSTSGDYERFFFDEKSGERIHHILNPATGRPANEVISVTVLGPAGLDTDPLSTSVFVLGVDKGLALINGLELYDCVIIDAKGKVHYSRGLAPPES